MELWERDGVGQIDWTDLWEHGKQKQSYNGGHRGEQSCIKEPAI